MSDAPEVTDFSDLRNRWASYHIAKSINAGRKTFGGALEGYIPIPKNDDDYEIPTPPPLAPEDGSHGHENFREGHQTINIGVVGAGCAGLFTGMVLNYLNEKLAEKGVPLTFKYDIYEAASSDRLGGRLFSYNFGGPPEAHDYYDVGAMRFPDNPVMKR